MLGGLVKRGLNGCMSGMASNGAKRISRWRVFTRWIYMLDVFLSDCACVACVDVVSSLEWRI